MKMRRFSIIMIFIINLIFYSFSVCLSLYKYFHTIVLIGVSKLFVKWHCFLGAIKHYFDTTHLFSDLCRMRNQSASKAHIFIASPYAHVLNMPYPTAIEDKFRLYKKRSRSYHDFPSALSLRYCSNKNSMKWI